MTFKLVPLIILGVLSCINLGIVFGKHGEKRDDYNGWTTLIAGIMEWGLILWMIL